MLIDREMRAVHRYRIRRPYIRWKRFAADSVQVQQRGIDDSTFDCSLRMPRFIVSGFDMIRTDHSPLWPGVPIALAAAGLFGAAAPFAKLLLGAVEPQLLAGLFYLGAGIGLAAVHFGRAAFRIPAPEAPLRAGDLPWLAAVVAFGGVLGPLLLMLGLARTEATSGSLLLNLEGLFTMAIAWVVFRENVDRRLLLGALAILAGAAVLSWGGRGVEIDTGALLIAAACLAWGIDNHLTRKLSPADPVLTAMIKGLAAGAVNAGLAMLGGDAVPSAGVTAATGIVG